MARIVVQYEHDDHFHVEIGKHGLVTDQPFEDGGDDLGPTPVELFVASLAACIGFYAERFMRRHDIDTGGLGVRCDFTMSEERPARVAEIGVCVDLPEGFPEDRRPVLMRVIEACTVHNSMRQPPVVRIETKARRHVA